MSRNDRIYKVFVAGTANYERAEPFADLAAAVEGWPSRNWILITGPGTGALPLGRSQVSNLSNLAASFACISLLQNICSW